MIIDSLTTIILNTLFLHTGRQISPDVAVMDGRKVSLDDINTVDRDQLVTTLASMLSSHTWPAGRA